MCAKDALLLVDSGGKKMRLLHSVRWREDTRTDVLGRSLMAKGYR